MFTRIKERTTTEDTFEIPILPPWLKIQKYQISFFKKFFCIEQSIYKGFGYPGKFSYIYTHIKHIMEDFNLRKYLAENKQIKGEMDAPYHIIQNTLKQLAGYWTADIKNNLDNLGAEEFKKQLDDLKPYIDQYFGD